MVQEHPRTLPDQPVWLQDAPRNVLFHIRSSGPVSSYAYQRLRLLQTKFELYTMDPSLHVEYALNFRKSTHVDAYISCITLLDFET